VNRRVSPSGYLRDLLTTKDCLFRLSDPIPYFVQLIVFLQFILIGWKNSSSALEASTRDICWNKQGIG
jgi:hypothetical protein